MYTLRAKSTAAYCRIQQPANLWLTRMLDINQ